MGNNQSSARNATNGALARGQLKRAAPIAAPTAAPLHGFDEEMKLPSTRKGKWEHLNLDLCNHMLLLACLYAWGFEDWRSYQTKMEKLLLPKGPSDIGGVPLDWKSKRQTMLSRSRTVKERQRDERREREERVSRQENEEIYYARTSNHTYMQMTRARELCLQVGARSAKASGKLCPFRVNERVNLDWIEHTICRKLGLPI